MTICTASVFLFNNANVGEPEDYTSAIVAAADRTWTDEGLRIEYVGSVKKRVSLGTTWAMVAGDLTVHTAVIRKLISRAETLRALPTLQVAEMYADMLREYTAEQAERAILAPYRMTLTELIHTDSELTRDLRARFESYSEGIEFEALVMGVEDRRPTLISINRNGFVRQHDDIGHASIGIGDIHAAAYYMQSGHSNMHGYYQALWKTFCAKKRAQIAPGVGTETDLMVITRDRTFDVAEAVKRKLEALYEKQKKERSKQDGRISAALQAENFDLFDEPNGLLALRGKNFDTPENSDSDSSGIADDIAAALGEKDKGPDED